MFIYILSAAKIVKLNTFLKLKTAFFRHSLYCIKRIKNTKIYFQSFFKYTKASSKAFFDDLGLKPNSCLDLLIS